MATHRSHFWRTVGPWAPACQAPRPQWATSGRSPQGLGRAGTCPTHGTDLQCSARRALGSPSSGSTEVIDGPFGCPLERHTARLGQACPTLTPPVKAAAPRCSCLILRHTRCLAACPVPALGWLASPVAVRGGAESLGPHNSLAQARGGSSSTASILTFGDASSNLARPLSGGRTSSIRHDGASTAASGRGPPPRLAALGCLGGTAVPQGVRRGTWVHAACRRADAWILPVCSCTWSMSHHIMIILPKGASSDLERVRLLRDGMMARGSWGWERAHLDEHGGCHRRFLFLLGEAFASIAHYGVHASFTCTFACRSRSR